MRLEQLAWLAANPRYTRRLVLAVGRRCRSATIKDVAQDMDLHWETVKDLDILYMKEQLQLAGSPNPQAIGIDEISIGPGHSYRIVVSDLIRKRAIWFGGTDRSEASMDLFYASLSQENREKHRCHGHVEGVPCLGPATPASGGDYLRQVPHHESSGEGFG